MLGDCIAFGSSVPDRRNSKEVDPPTGARPAPGYTDTNVSATASSRLLFLLFSGWVNRQQQDVIDLCLPNSAFLLWQLELRTDCRYPSRP
jgi:hypothetical protein